MNACPKSVFLQQRVVASAAHNFRGQGFFNRRWYCRDMLLFNCSSDCPMLTIHDVNYTTRQSSSTAAVQRVVVNFSLTTCSRYSAFLIEIFVFSRHLRDEWSCQKTAIIYTAITLVRSLLPHRCFWGIRSFTIDDARSTPSGAPNLSVLGCIDVAFDGVHQ